MAKIVVITSGLTGIVNASFRLVEQLQNLGHEVIYACPQNIEKKVKAQGISYTQLSPINYEPAPELPRKIQAANKLKKLSYKWQNRKIRQKQAIEALRMKGFRQKVEEWQADLYILDVELHEYIMTLVARKKPVLLLSQWFSLWHRKGLPSLLDTTIPGEGWAGSRLGLAISWQKIKGQRWWMFAKKYWRSGGTNRRTVLQKYAQKVGFPSRYIRENYWPGPFVYGELPVISMTASELEFPHEERPNHWYIGPLVQKNRIDTHTDEALQKRLEAIFLEKKQTGKSLIYCSVSTYRKGDQAFLKKVIEAVKGQQNWLLVIGLGGMLESDFFEKIPENIHAFNWIPQLKVLAEADLSINHGGIHTINECLYFSVPMLVYSGKRSDQNGCAARVHYHQIGLMADKDLDGVGEIREKIGRVLTEKNFRENINKMRIAVQRYENGEILQEAIMQNSPIYHPSGQ